MIRSPAMRLLVLATASVLSLACGPAQTQVAKPGDSKTSGSGSAGVGIEKAQLPYKILRARGGTEIDEATFLGELKAASAVCIGENHKNPHHHWAQLHLFDALSAHNQTVGRKTALGMEMFQRPFQGVLDDYVAKKIDLEAMLSRTGYADRWGFDWGFYGPTVDLAIARMGVVLALNTERELTKRVARVGINSLTAVERAKLPELNLEDAVHRAWWTAIMGDMSHPSSGDATHGSDPHAPSDSGGEPPADDSGAHAKPDPAPQAPVEDGKRPDDRSEWIYSAQVLWDETMADGAARWLRAGGNRQVIVIAGNGHCHDSAIVGRLKRRGIGNVVSVRPLIDKGDGELAAKLVTPENDYIFVMTLPTK